MSYFDSKVIDHFSSYGKVIGLTKSCQCGALVTSTPMPNIVESCLVCGVNVHTAYIKGKPSV